MRQRINAEATTSAMEETLLRVEELCGESNITLKRGSYIGKSPQTLILERSRDESSTYLYADGRMKIWNEEVDPWSLTPEEFEVMYRRHEEVSA